MSEAGLRSRKDFWFACVDVDVMRDNELSLTARFIFAVLCTFSSMAEGRNCWPSNDTLAKAAGVSKRTVIRALMELKDRGVIVRFERFLGEGGQTSSYTRIVGHNAKCYQNSEEDCPRDTDDTPPSPQATPKQYQHEEYIKDSLKGGDGLPGNSGEQEQTGGTASIQNPKEGCIPDDNAERVATMGDTASIQNPREVCTPDDAPDIFKQTAKYFLHETGRSGLTPEDISALRTLNVNHTPYRIQKEIDTACDRFRRRGQSLTALTFEYIAKSLANQQSRKKPKNKNARPETALTGITSADIERLNEAKKLTPEEFERINAQIEADIREGRIL